MHGSLAQAVVRRRHGAGHIRQMRPPHNGPGSLGPLGASSPHVRDRASSREAVQMLGRAKRGGGRARGVLPVPRTHTPPRPRQHPRPRTDHNPTIGDRRLADADARLLLATRGAAQ